MNSLIALCISFMLCFSIPAYGFVNLDPGVNCFENSYNNPNGKNIPVKYAWNKEGEYQDVEGDALFEFIDLTRLKVVIDDNKVAINISLNHIPNVLIFNHANLSNDVLEYEWAVYFNVGGTPGNEISLSISSYKVDRKESLGSILGETQHDLWLLDAEQGKNVRVNVETTLLDKSTLSLVVRKKDHEALRKITAKTPVRFSAEYNFAGKVCKDTYPDTEL